MRPGLLGLVAVVEDEAALGQEEGEEADAGEHPDLLRIADGLHRLREDVEEGDRDDDAAGQRDRGYELAAQAQGDEAAAERGEDREAGKRERDPGHARPSPASPPGRQSRPPAPPDAPRGTALSGPVLPTLCPPAPHRERRPRNARVDARRFILRAPRR